MVASFWRSKLGNPDRGKDTLRHGEIDAGRSLGVSLSTQILLGLDLGALTGIFIGELAAPLKIVGTGFVRLLQMTVLPCRTFSLVFAHGFFWISSVPNPTPRRTSR